MFGAICRFGILLLFLHQSPTLLAADSLRLVSLASQSSYYVHRELLQSYTEQRSTVKTINFHIHVWPGSFPSSKLKQFQRDEPMLGDKRFAEEETETVDFLLDDGAPVVRLKDDLIWVPAYIHGVGIVYNAEQYNTAPGEKCFPISLEAGHIYDMMMVDDPNFAWTRTKFPGIPKEAAAQLENVKFQKENQTGRSVFAANDSSVRLFSRFMKNSVPQKWLTWPVASSMSTIFNSTVPPFIDQPKAQDNVLGAVFVKYGAIGLVNWVNVNAFTGGSKKIAFVKINNIAPTLASFKNATSWLFNQSAEYDHQDVESITNSLAAKKDLYPLLSTSYILIRTGRTNLDECEKAVEVLRYIRWLYESSNVTAVTNKFEVVQLPKSVTEKVLQTLKTTLYCNNTESKNVTTWEAMLSAIEDEKPYDYAYAVGMYGVLPLGILILIVLAIMYWWKKYCFMKKVQQGCYDIPTNAITFIEASKERYREMLRMRPYLDNSQLDVEFCTGELGTKVVLLRHLQLEYNSAGRKIQAELVNMQDQFGHQNLLRFLGVCSLRRRNYIVSELSLLGDLRTLLSNSNLKLTPTISFSMGKGTVAGIQFLHDRDIVHGNLRSPSVYVESDWTVKISDWEYTHIYSLHGTFISREQTFKVMQRASPEAQNVFFTPLLWTAPEVLKGAMEQTILKPTKAADVYSAGVIFYEILTRSYPYKFDPDLGKGPLSILLRILNPKRPLRPLDLESEEVLHDVPDSMLNLMRSCWQEDPQTRITIHGFADVLRSLEADTKRMADLTIVNTGFVIDRQKTDIKNTNSDIKQRLQDLRKANEDFMTPAIYDKIRSRLPVEPKIIDRAYVIHLTMVEYSELLDPTYGESAIALIERFQTLLTHYITSKDDSNIFRLHTNGDDCTIIGSVPEGGVEYADKIAVMALDILAITWKVVMLDIDIDHMKVRIGIHCGPVLAGIYGNNHSEFTVIGDARDMAEDMERLSATYRILVTQDFIDDLKLFKGFKFIRNTDPRRQHDRFKSYWLLGRENHAEAEALQDIDQNYGAITDGNIPIKPKPKPKVVSKIVKPNHSNKALKEAGGTRRMSMEAHLAFKEEKKDAPLILERRTTEPFAGNAQPVGIRPDHEARGSVEEVQRERFGSITTVAEATEMHVMRIENKTDLLIVSVPPVDNADIAPYMPTKDLTESKSVLPEIEAHPSEIFDEMIERNVVRRQTIAQMNKESFVDDLSAVENLSTADDQLPEIQPPPEVKLVSVPNNADPPTHSNQIKPVKHFGVQAGMEPKITITEETQTSFKNLHPVSFGAKAEQPPVVEEMVTTRTLTAEVFAAPSRPNLKDPLEIGQPSPEIRAVEDVVQGPIINSTVMAPPPHERLNVIHNDEPKTSIVDVLAPSDAAMRIRRRVRRRTRDPDTTENVATDTCSLDEVERTQQAAPTMSNQARGQVAALAAKFEFATSKVTQRTPPKATAQNANNRSANRRRSSREAAEDVDQPRQPSRNR